MSFYVKKLYDNELGYRKKIPNKAGKFLLISKKKSNFFHPKSDEIDPSMSLGIIINDMKHMVHAEYTMIMTLYQNTGVMIEGFI